MTILPIKYKKELNAVSKQFSVELSGVGKKYHLVKFPHEKQAESEFWALRDINFSVEEGQVMGIIGRNGAGKTTLLNIISGALTPSEGKIFVKSRVLGLFSLGIGFQDELSGKENIFLNGTLLGAARKEIEVKLPEIIDFSELGDFINMPLGAYSQGMRLRLGFSVIANLDFDILVIDEVLAVGDGLFQDKCFKRLADFKRSGKTLIITAQGLDLIERLCDKVVFLNHGKMEFCGDVLEGINRYRVILNTEKFFVGPVKKEPVVENTKKWADDIGNWGKKFGTKEIEINSVRFINRFGFECRNIKSGQPLKIKVDFAAKNTVRNPHFGIAIFRGDGVYCYGPNTEFDGYKIPELKPGRGWCVLSYKKLLLAPGEYFFSVAIWDKNETLAFDYHDGCYKLTVGGHKNRKGTLINLPFKLSYAVSGLINSNLTMSIKLSDSQGKEKDTFITNQSLRIKFNFSNLSAQNKNSYVNLSIFRDDGVLCQEITAIIKRNEELSILFPNLGLLPGGYQVSVGEVIYPFRMVFNQEDHGTVYLEHSWRRGCF